MIYDIAMRRGERRDFVEACTKFYIRELKLEKSRFELVVLTEKDMLKNKGLNGGIIQFGAKEVGVILDSRIPAWQLIITLAHEMIHVKQVAKGRLRTTIENGAMVNTWQGKRMDVPYHERPWEHEAWAQERLLSHRLQAAFELPENA